VGERTGRPHRALGRVPQPSVKPPRVLMQGSRSASRDPSCLRDSTPNRRSPKSRCFPIERERSSPHRLSSTMRDDSEAGVPVARQERASSGGGDVLEITTHLSTLTLSPSASYRITSSTLIEAVEPGVSRTISRPSPTAGRTALSPASSSSASAPARTFGEDLFEGNLPAGAKPWIPRPATHAGQVADARIVQAA
jgi:hypothetical protein